MSFRGRRFTLILWVHVRACRRWIMKYLKVSWRKQWVDLCPPVFTLIPRLYPHRYHSSLRCIPAHRRSAVRLLSPHTGRANTADSGTNPPAPPAGYTTLRDIPPRSRSGTSARPTPRTHPSHTWIKKQRANIKKCHVTIARKNMFGKWTHFQVECMIRWTNHTHLLPSHTLTPVAMVTTSAPVRPPVIGWSQCCPVQPGWQWHWGPCERQHVYCLHNVKKKKKNRSSPRPSLLFCVPQSFPTWAITYRENEELLQTSLFAATTITSKCSSHPERELSDGNK